MIQALLLSHIGGFSEFQTPFSQVTKSALHSCTSRCQPAISADDDRTLHAQKQVQKLSLPGKPEYLDLVAHPRSEPASQPVLITRSHCDLLIRELQIGDDALRLDLVQGLDALELSAGGPDLDHSLAVARGEDIGLLDAVQGAYPGRVRVGVLVNGLLLLLCPQVDGAVLACRDALLLVDGPNPIDGVVVALQDDLALFFSLPNHHLVIVTRTHKIIRVDGIDVQHFGVVAVVGLDDAPLCRLPLFHGEIRAHRTQVIGVDSKLNPIDRISMPLQSVDNGVGSHIPQLDGSILAGSGDHLTDGVVAHAQDGSLVVEGTVLLGHSYEVLLAGFAVPVDDATVLGHREDPGVGDFEAGDALGVALVGDGLAYDHLPEMRLLVYEQLVLASELSYSAVTYQFLSSSARVFSSASPSTLLAATPPSPYSQMKKSSPGRLSLTVFLVSVALVFWISFLAMEILTCSGVRRSTYSRPFRSAWCGSASLGRSSELIYYSSSGDCFLFLLRAPCLGIFIVDRVYIFYYQPVHYNPADSTRPTITLQQIYLGIDPMHPPPNLLDQVHLRIRDGRINDHNQYCFNIVANEVQTNAELMRVRRSLQELDNLVCYINKEYGGHVIPICQSVRDLARDLQTVDGKIEEYLQDLRENHLCSRDLKLYCFVFEQAMVLPREQTYTKVLTSASNLSRKYLNAVFTRKQLPQEKQAQRLAAYYHKLNQKFESYTSVREVILGVLEQQSLLDETMTAFTEISGEVCSGFEPRESSCIEIRRIVRISDKYMRQAGQAYSRWEILVEGVRELQNNVKKGLAEDVHRLEGRRQKLATWTQSLGDQFESMLDYFDSALELISTVIVDLRQKSIQVAIASEQKSGNFIDRISTSDAQIGTSQGFRASAESAEEEKRQAQGMYSDQTLSELDIASQEEILQV